MTNAAVAPAKDTSTASKDPELESLPKPRRPGRRLTLLLMAVTGILSTMVAWSLRADLAYTFREGPPADLGELSKLHPSQDHANRWIRGQGALVAAGALRYHRPLERDAYQLARVEGNDRLWVQVQIPVSMRAEHFVPPGSFVGRLVPVAGAGLRFAALDEAASDMGTAPLPGDAWLLVDGETPESTSWAVGVVALLVGFVAFNGWGLFQLLRPV
jgi:hypothetical protein